MLLFNFVIICGIFKWRWIYAGVCLCVYVLPLEIQLSRRDGWDTIKRFNTAILLCLSQAKTWVPNRMCRGIFFFVNGKVIIRFVDIGGIDDLHCVNFLLFCWYWWNWWPSMFKLSFCFVDIGGIDDHHCLTFLLFCWYWLVELMTINV